MALISDNDFRADKTHRSYTNPLTDEFPSLKNLEISFFWMDNFYNPFCFHHGTSNENVNDVLKRAPLQWLMANRGLEYFKLHCDETCYYCWSHSEIASDVVNTLTDVERRIREAVTKSRKATLASSDVKAMDEEEVIE